MELFPSMLIRQFDTLVRNAATIRVLGYIYCIKLRVFLKFCTTERVWKCRPSKLAQQEAVPRLVHAPSPVRTCRRLSFEPAKIWLDTQPRSWLGSFVSGLI